ncbi:MAG TPA: hypothetical protein VJK03_01465 [Candidatus Nanoarchaeia archaeon]|nr:hypothetical protein [Candidatus Nanoarchaeia archaeon]
MMWKKAQLKIQEMAFVLIAVMVFFALVALLYLSVRSSQLQSGAQEIRDAEARAGVRALASLPELRWDGCPNCIDGDKAFLIKNKMRNNADYAGLWHLDYLALEIIYPPRAGGECTAATYPACNHTTIIGANGSYGIASAAYVSVCLWNPGQESVRCDLGKISASGRNVR